MIEQAIPGGTSSWRHTPTEYRRSVAWFALLVVCFIFMMGCRKPAAPTVVVPQSSGGQAAAAQPGEGASGRNTILQMPFDNVAKLVLLNIGRSYQMASIANGKPPKDAVELDAGVMKTKRDMQDHEVEVVYGVNPKRLGDEPGEYMLAWEKLPTNDGYRMVLMADFTTVKYVSQAEFEKMKKAK